MYSYRELYEIRLFCGWHGEVVRMTQAVSAKKKNVIALSVKLTISRVDILNTPETAIWL